MSYDLLVFDPASAPADREAFLRWHAEHSDERDEHEGIPSGVANPALKSWFKEIANTFPPLNGPLADEDIENPKLTEYTGDASLIHVAFAWSQAAEAYRTVVMLAKKHGVGFFDASGRYPTVWRPDSSDVFEVFYHFEAADQSVSGDEPVLMHLCDVCDHLFGNLQTEGDFLGIADTANTTLQFMYHADQDHYWLEIPVPQQGGSYGTYLSREALQALLRDLPATFQVEDFPDFRFNPWNG